VNPLVRRRGIIPRRRARLTPWAWSGDADRYRTVLPESRCRPDAAGSVGAAACGRGYLDLRGLAHRGRTCRAPLSTHASARGTRALHPGQGRASRSRPNPGWVARRPRRTRADRGLVRAWTGAPRRRHRRLRGHRDGLGHLRRGGGRSVPRIDGAARVQRLHPSRHAIRPAAASQRDLQRALRVERARRTRGRRAPARLGAARSAGCRRCGVLPDRRVAHALAARRPRDQALLACTGAAVRAAHGASRTHASIAWRVVLLQRGGDHRAPGGARGRSRRSIRS
jgi:hypothetical protein